MKNTLPELGLRPQPMWVHKNYALFVQLGAVISCCWSHETVPGGCECISDVLLSWSAFGLHDRQMSLKSPCFTFEVPVAACRGVEICWRCLWKCVSASKWTQLWQTGDTGQIGEAKEQERKREGFHLRVCESMLAVSEKMQDPKRFLI